jgi:hypothetical protein
MGPGPVFARIGRKRINDVPQLCSLGKTAYIRTLLQRLVIDGNRAVNEVIVLC